MYLTPPYCNLRLSKWLYFGPIHLIPKLFHSINFSLFLICFGILGIILFNQLWSTNAFCREHVQSPITFIAEVKFVLQQESQMTDFPKLLHLYPLQVLSVTSLELMFQFSSLTLFNNTGLFLFMQAVKAIQECILRCPKLNLPTKRRRAYMPWHHLI